MSSFRHHFPYYRVNADGRLTHCAASDAGNLPFHWAEIDPKRKPEPTDAQLDSLHCEADLFGEPQIKENIRKDLEGFRDIWVHYWSYPLPTPFDPGFEAETNLNPLTLSLAKRFADAIASYPRILLPSGFVQLGGVQFVGPLRPPMGKPYIARTIPTEEANRGAIDFAMSLFKEHIRNVGQRCDCTCEAIEVMGRFDTLIAWLEDANGIDDSDIASLIGLSDLLEDALHAMSIAVAKSATTRPASSPTSPQTDHHSSQGHHNSHRDRLPKLTDQAIANMFSAKSTAYIKGINCETKAPIYETKRGGGTRIIGKCSARTIRDWLKKHPDANHSEPRSGFHAGMLTDKVALEKAVTNWGRYCLAVAKQFFEWRKTHSATPFSQFRAKFAQIEHWNNL